MRFWIMVVAVCLLAGNANAAKLTFLGETTGMEFDVQSVDPDAKCNMRLSGTIEKGDLAQLKTRITYLRELVRETSGSRVIIVCLDSPGGSFVEAVRTGKYFKKENIGTKIEAGARCESACSLIFMSGNFFAHESGVYHWRVLHPDGKLGFHSPSLTLGEGNYNAKTVQKAYNLALKTISDTIFQVMTSPDTEAGLSMEVSLLGEMLKTPSTQMMYVDTVDEVGRWEITLVRNWGTRTINKNRLIQGCLNVFHWVRDETAIGKDYGGLENFFLNREKDENGTEKAVVSLNDMTGEGCEIFLPEQSDKLSDVGLLEVTYKGSHSISSEHFFDPKTAIADLATLSPRGNQSTPNTPTPATQGLAGATGECMVISGANILDHDPCIRADHVKQDSSNRRMDVASFVWPSGAKTVIVVGVNGMSINGQPYSSRTKQPCRGECYLRFQSLERQRFLLPPAIARMLLERVLFSLPSL